jgi:hypothetical protein
MSKFLPSKTFKIDLGDDEYIEFGYYMSYVHELELSNMDITDPYLLGGLKVFYLAKKWNLKDEEGKVPVLDKENFFSKLRPEVLSDVIGKVVAELAKERKDAFEIMKKNSKMPDIEKKT